MIFSVKTQNRSLIFIAFFFGLAAVPSGLVAKQSFESEGYPPTVRKEVGTSWTVNGTVKTASGIPVPESKAFLSRGLFRYNPMSDNDFDLTAVTTGNSRGEIELEAKENLQIVAWAPRMAPAIVSAPEGSEFRIELDAGRSVSGRLTSKDGKPVSGVKVKPVSILYRRTKDELSKFNPLVLDRSPSFRVVALEFPNFGKECAVETDANGRFWLDRLPRDMRVKLAFEKVGFLGEAVWTEAQEDDQSLHFATEPLLGDSFEHVLQRCQVVSFQGRDQKTKQPIKLARIRIDQGTGPIVERSNFEAIREFPSASRVQISLPDFPEGCRFWVEPDDPRYLGQRVILEPSIADREIKLSVEFTKGIPISGNVTNAANQHPIEGAHLQWMSSDQALSTENGQFVKTGIQTNEVGEYFISVPDQEGVLGLIGGVQGFRSVGSWNSLSQISKELTRLRFSKTLTKSRLSAENNLDFAMLPSSKILIQVLQPNGSTAPESFVTANLDQPHPSGGPFAYRRMESAVADSNGVVQFKNWYENEWMIGLAQKAFEESNLDDSNPEWRYQRNGYPTVVGAVSPGGQLQAAATIPLPTDGDLTPIRVELNMSPTASVMGQVVNQNKEPVGNLEIMVLPGASAPTRQIWKTKTRKDGRFKLTGLPSGSAMEIRIDIARVKSTFRDGVIRIADSELKPGQTFDLPTIECFDLSDLAGEIPTPNLAGLSPEQALDRVANFAKQQLSRVPIRDERFFNPRDRMDPILLFEQRVAGKLFPLLSDLATKRPGSPFQLKVIQAFTSLLPNKPPSSFSKERKFAIDQLMEHHLDNPDAQSVLLSAVAGIDQVSGTHTAAWVAIEKKSPIESTRRTAQFQLAAIFSKEAINNCRKTLPDRQFKSSFEKLDQLIQRMEQTVSKQARSIDDKALKVFRSHLDALLRRYAAQIDISIIEDPTARERLKKSEFDKDRFRQWRECCDRLFKS